MADPASSAMTNPDVHSPHARRALLCVSVCGAPSSGKTTLVERLLAGRGAASEDGGAFAAQSTRLARSPGLIERTLLPERLLSDREGGAGSQVAFRFFSSGRQSFLVVDAAGGDAHMRESLAAVAAAHVSLIVVDASEGVGSAARRHGILASLVAVPSAVLVVTKMDSVGYSREVFARITDEYRALAEELRLPLIASVPVSGLAGDAIVEPSPALSWYEGPSLLELLDAVDDGTARALERPLRMPVRAVTTGQTGGAGLSGTIVTGSVRRGDAVRVQPSGRVSRVARILVPGGELEHANAGHAVTLVLDDVVEASRGDLVAEADRPAEVAHQFEATVVWMSPSPLLRGRSYHLDINGGRVTATIAPIKHRINVDTLERVAAAKLHETEIGVCNVELDRPIPFDPSRESAATGSFVLVDPVSSETVGAGVLHFALRRAQNVHWQALDVNKTARSSLMGQKPCLLWFTGLSGAGKSTIANLVDKKLHSLGRHSYLLDGDNVRHGLNKDLGFTDADRVENIRRIAEVAKLMVDAGLIVGTAFISPFRAERQMARALLPDEFIEIFVDTPLTIAEQRDPKGLYKKARRGELKNFTGIDSPYEPPENPEIRIDTTTTTPEGAAELIVAYLEARGAFAVAR